MFERSALSRAVIVHVFCTINQVFAQKTGSVRFKNQAKRLRDRCGFARSFELRFDTTHVRVKAWTQRPGDIHDRPEY